MQQSTDQGLAPSHTDLASMPIAYRPEMEERPANELVNEHAGCLKRYEEDEESHA
jgi:hypothetical protein